MIGINKQIQHLLLDSLLLKVKIFLTKATKIIIVITKVIIADNQGIKDI